MIYRTNEAPSSDETKPAKVCGSTYLGGGKLTRKRPCSLPWRWPFRFEDGDRYECACGRVYVMTCTGGLLSEWKEVKRKG